MYNRYLFVGLGGSGGKTLRFLKDQMQKWMTAHGMPPQIPGAWRFLHIDTPHNPDGQGINDLADPLAPDEYLGLAAHNSSYVAIQKELDHKPRIAPEMATWRVEPTAVHVPLAHGAGQYRAIGSTIALAYASRIRAAVTENLNRLKQVDSTNDLAEVFRRSHPGSTPAVQNASTYAVVVSSLSGGSGAGLLHTVCDILASEGEGGAEQPIAILFTPEVFRALAPAATNGVQANALAAICELLNGYWWGGNPDDPEGIMHPPAVSDPVLREAGCSSDLPRSGPYYPFLVGMQNAAGVSYGSHDQLFEMVGRAMSSWVVDLKVNEQFVAHTTGNWQQSAQDGGAVLADVSTGAEMHEMDHPAVSALGFTRLEVGMGYFENYAAERLMRCVYDHLVHYHHKSEAARRAQGALKHSDPAEVVNHLAAERLPRFLRDMGIDPSWLSEPGDRASADHPMAEQMSPADPMEAFCRAVEEQMPPGVREKPDWWEEQILRAAEERLPSARSAYQDALADSAGLWVENIQTKTLSAANREMGRSGLLVAARCCELASETLRGMSDKFAEEAADMDGWATRWKTALTGWPVSADDKMSSDNNAVLDRIDEVCGAGLGWRVNHMAMDKTAAMLGEASERLLKTLAETLRQSHKAAEREGGDYPNWADNQAVSEMPPLSIGPPTGTLTLLDQQHYKTYFEHLLARTFAEPQGAPLEQARAAITDSALAKVAPSGGWWPAGMHHSSDRQPKSVTVNAGVRRGDLRESALAWLRRAGSPFGEFLQITLRSMFSGESQRSSDVRALLDQSEMESRFKDRMNEALRSAAPLINVDDAMFGLVHPGVRKSNRLACSAIPLDGLPIKEKVAEILRSHHIDEGVIDSNFDADDSTAHIDITSCFDSPRSVLTVKSLYKPIADDWESSIAQDKRTAFWSRRRARPLHRFVPAPHALLLAIIRGWFIGSLLGQIELRDPVPVVARPGGRPPAAFPQRFHPQRPESLGWLANVLESLSLAYVQSSRQGSLAPLEAYMRLRDLGTAGPDSASTFSYFTYKSIGAELREWVDHGSISPTPIGVVKVSAGADPPVGTAGRAEAVSSVLRRAIQEHERSYNELEQEWAARPATLSHAPLWAGAWREMRQALEQIDQAVVDHQKRSATRDVLH